MLNESLKIHVAKTFFARLIGLLGRTSLPPDEALLISRCAGVHTWFMRFAIDALWLDENNRVIGMAENLKPWKTARGPVGTVHCLELAAGGVKRQRIGMGQVVIVTDWDRDPSLRSG